jgi:hypothetical protein
VRTWLDPLWHSTRGSGALCDLGCNCESRVTRMTARRPVVADSDPTAPQRCERFRGTADIIGRERSVQPDAHDPNATSANVSLCGAARERADDSLRAPAARGITSVTLVLRDALASQALPQGGGRDQPPRVNGGIVGRSFCTSPNLHRRCFRSSRCNHLAGRRSRSFHYMIARRGRRSSLGSHRVCTWPYTPPSPGRRRRPARVMEPPTILEPRRG